MTSTWASATGRCSISPRRKSTFFASTLRAFARALLTMSGVMSTPITRPVGPTCRAARKQSMPPPLPRSSTVSPGRSAAIARGFPQPRPMLAPSGKRSSSALVYPSWMLADGVAQHPGVHPPCVAPFATLP
jgi:hypothetical protein